ncbi:hypothetical protein ABZ920_17800 [Streptomyces sp. NPDC046831]|uniref:hypothetical protein n=1 Tax=Streptomyces sp. NPDC046831 TaxID=3154805 RepID=UPI0033E01CC9
MTPNDTGPAGTETGPAAAGAERGQSPEQRLSQLEAQVATLVGAVRALARGLEDVPAEEPRPEEAARGARLAHELLLAQGL